MLMGDIWLRINFLPKFWDSAYREHLIVILRGKRGLIRRKTLCAFFPKSSRSPRSFVSGLLRKALLVEQNTNVWRKCLLVWPGPDVTILVKHG